MVLPEEEKSIAPLYNTSSKHTRAYCEMLPAFEEVMFVGVCVMEFAGRENLLLASFVVVFPSLFSVFHGAHVVNVK